MITINGDVFVTVYNKDLDLNSGIDMDLPFDDFDDCEDECDGDCESCEYGEEDDYSLEDDGLDDLLEEYVNLLSEACICPECLEGILKDFALDFLNYVIENGKH